MGCLLFIQNVGNSHTDIFKNKLVICQMRDLKKGEMTRKTCDKQVLANIHCPAKNRIFMFMSLFSEVCIKTSQGFILF